MIQCSKLRATKPLRSHMRGWNPPIAFPTACHFTGPFQGLKVGGGSHKHNLSERALILTYQCIILERQLLTILDDPAPAQPCF